MYIFRLDVIQQNHIINSVFSKKVGVNHEKIAAIGANYFESLKLIFCSFRICYPNFRKKKKREAL